MIQRCVLLLVTGLFLGALTACGPQVEVPPAHVGKKSTASGLQEGVIRPSKFRLERFCVNCDSLILAEASDYSIRESMKIFMPEDQLNLTVDVRGTFAISSSQENVNKIFDRITPQPTKQKRVSIIPMQKVYSTYAQPIIRETVRSIVTKYSIHEVMTNRDNIGQELANSVHEKLSKAPLNAIYFGLADIQPPDVIVKAQEARKEKEIAIEKAEAEKLVKLKEAEAAYEVAIKQQQVDLKEAETQVLVNQKLAEGVNEAFIKQRALRILEKMAGSDNKIFFLPMEVMSNPAMMLGAFQEDQNRK